MSQSNKSKTGLWALCLKFGSKVFSLLAKFFKLTKIGLAAASFAGYALLFSWKFALLILIAIGFHESGHVWAMKRMGIKTKGFYFIPFIGGAAIAEEQYKTYGQNAYIAIMGPVWGMLLASITATIYCITNVPLFAAAAAWIAMINLFNLLCIHPLDGGQLVRAIAFSIHKTLGLVFMALSMVLGIIIMWKLRIGLFALILFVGGIELFIEARNRVKLYQVACGKLDSYKLPASMFNNDGNLKVYPIAMNKIQILYTSAAYIGAIVGLLIILLSLKDIPGADIAANFLR